MGGVGSRLMSKRFVLKAVWVTFTAHCTACQVLAGIRILLMLRSTASV